MFKFVELKSIHIEISNNCQASCPMCPRNIHGGLPNNNIKIQNWTLSEFKKIFSKSVLNTIDGFYFCGNYGDPLLNADLLEMVDYASNINDKLNIRIHTNGSLRSHQWWTDLANVMPDTGLVVFALDGLEDTHSLYRIGTNFNTVIENAKSYIATGKAAEWAFIKFKHNEHQVDEIRKLAKELGFTRLSIKNSSRWVATDKFNVVDKEGKTIYYLEPAESNHLQLVTPEILKNYKSIVANSIIDCQSIQKKEIYIDAYKNVYPCCWIAQIPHDYTYNDISKDVRTDIKRQYYELVERLGGLEKLNAANNSLEDIIMSYEYQTVYKEYWQNRGLITCARQCGKTDLNFAKSKDQWIESSKLNA